MLSLTCICYMAFVIFCMAVPSVRTAESGAAPQTNAVRRRGFRKDRGAAIRFPFPSARRKKEGISQTNVPLHGRTADPDEASVPFS